MKKSASTISIVLIIALYIAIETLNERGSTPDTPPAAPAVTQEQAFTMPATITLPADEAWMTGAGEVIKVLRDDNKGSRRQKFILRVSEQQTLLVAHNIELAPRVEPIAEGDLIHFRGQYETNNRDGVIHWTHHDPKGRREGGWLKSNGITYK